MAAAHRGAAPPDETGCAWTDGCRSVAGHNTFRVCGRRRTQTFVTVCHRTDRRRPGRRLPTAIGDRGHRHGWCDHEVCRASRPHLPMIPATVHDPHLGDRVSPMRSGAAPEHYPRRHRAPVINPAFRRAGNRRRAGIVAARRRVRRGRRADRVDPHPGRYGPGSADSAMTAAGRAAIRSSCVPSRVDAAHRFRRVDHEPRRRRNPRGSSAPRGHQGGRRTATVSAAGSTSALRSRSPGARWSIRSRCDLIHSVLAGGERGRIGGGVGHENRALPGRVSSPGAGPGDAVTDHGTAVAADCKSRRGTTRRAIPPHPLPGCRVWLCRSVSAPTIALTVHCSTLCA